MTIDRPANTLSKAAVASKSVNIPGDRVWREKPKKGVCLKWHLMFGLGVHIGLGQRLRSIEHDKVVSVPI